MEIANGVNDIKTLLSKLVPEICEITKAEKISSNFSGSSVYFIECAKGKFILKHNINDNFHNFYRAQNELIFYTRISKIISIHVPELISYYDTNKEIMLLFEYYDKPALSDRMIYEGIKSLAAFHSKTINLNNLLVNLPIENVDSYYRSQFAFDKLEIWKNIIENKELNIEIKHIEEIAAKIKKYENLRDNFPVSIIHGDYFFDNLLIDGNGNIVIADWQETRKGTFIEDLAFFIERLKFEGYKIKTENVVESYIKNLQNVHDERINYENVLRAVRASILLDIYFLWPNYISFFDSSLLQTFVEKIIKMKEQID